MILKATPTTNSTHLKRWGFDMKLLREIADNYIATQLKHAAPNDIVERIWDLNQQKFVPLFERCFAKDIACPRCKQSIGFFPEPGSWSCLEDSCLKASWVIFKAKRDKEAGYIEPTPMDKLGVPHSLCSASIAKINQPVEILSGINKYITDPKGFMLLAGSPGLGKTYAACACMDYARNHGISSRFVNMADLYVNWLGMKQAGANEMNLLDKLFHPKLLVMDDLGARSPSEAYLEFIYILINKRCTTDCGTIVTTNMSSKDMREKLGDALFSRICSGQRLIFTGKDRRIPEIDF